MFYFVEQNVTLMTQLKINMIKSYKECPSCTNEVKKLHFMQKCIIRFVSIIFLKKNENCNL